MVSVRMLPGAPVILVGETEGVMSGACPSGCSGACPSTGACAGCAVDCENGFSIAT